MNPSSTRPRQGHEHALNCLETKVAGYEKETNHDAVMERVDAQGHVIGFSIMGVSQFRKANPLEADLVSA